jgi:hypothetical protein
MKIKRSSGTAVLAAVIIVAGIVTVFATSAPDRAGAAADTGASNAAPRDVEVPTGEPSYQGESTTALMPIDLTFSESDAGIPELIDGLNISTYRAVYLDNEICLRVTDAGAVQVSEDGGAAWKGYNADAVDAKDFAEWLLQNDPIPGYSMKEMQSRLESGAEVKHIAFEDGKEMYFVADANGVRIELVQSEKSASVLLDGQRMMITSVRYNPYIISSNMLRSFYDLLVSCGVATKAEAERDCAARTAWIESAEGFVINENGEMRWED